MKKAGELLGAFFDERVLRAAQGYSELFSAWRSLAGEKIAAHSRIAELEKSILVVEADHPGWIQILQMKQANILEGARKRFPQLSISGISFRLAKDGVLTQAKLPSGNEGLEGTKNTAGEEVITQESSAAQLLAKEGDPYAGISDESFKILLMRLDKSIKARNGTR